MAKLIVIGIILGFFGVVLLVVHMNYRREMRDRATRADSGAPSLDDQLDTVVRAGLPLTPGVTRDTLLALAPEEAYRATPYTLLLRTLAGTGPDGRPLSPRATLAHADLQRVTGHHSTAADLDTALADCAAHLPEGLGLFRLDDADGVVVLVLPVQGADTLAGMASATGRIVRVTA